MSVQPCPRLLARSPCQWLFSTRSQPDWHGWLIAAQLPAMLAAAGMTSGPLPCLTGLTRSMRYSTAGVAEIESLPLLRLAEQARDGLTMLQRLEACARAWRERLDGLTARSRAGQAAGAFLVWPVMTIVQIAAALECTQARAGAVIETLMARDIVERTMLMVQHSTWHRRAWVNLGSSPAKDGSSQHHR